MSLLVHQPHKAVELLDVESKVFLHDRPALWVLQGLQLDKGDIGVPALQLVCGMPHERRIAVMPYLIGVAEVGDLEHVEALWAWGQRSMRWGLGQRWRDQRGA